MKHTEQHKPHRHHPGARAYAVALATGLAARLFGLGATAARSGGRQRLARLAQSRV
ncbi:MAG: hypothetical protein R2854_03200 [Caldilineaceae bacterium]